GREFGQAAVTFPSASSAIHSPRFSVLKDPATKAALPYADTLLASLQITKERPRLREFADIQENLRVTAGKLTAGELTLEAPLKQIDAGTNRIIRKEQPARDMATGRAGRWFLLPGLVFLFAIDLIPLAYSAWVSFYNWWLIRPRDIRFVGLANYARFADDPEFSRAVVVTTLFTVGAVLVEFLAGLGLALLFEQPRKFLRPIRVLLLLPLFVVPVVGATMWRVIFHPELGVLNYYLGAIGLGPLPWLSDPRLALVSITIVDAWRTIPFMFLVMYAGLEGLPSELFEAGGVDGASAWQSFRHITMPLLTYIMLLAILIRGMDAFREFDIIFVLTGGGPGTATQTMQMLNYRAFGLGHMGEANAIGIVTLIFVAAM